MFAFGRNWRGYLSVLDDARIAAATSALRDLIGRDDLTGLRFLDAGSGSGLHSLAAYRLGADVVSFDYDPDSVACTETLRERYADGGGRRGGGRWEVRPGSLTDPGFLRGLGRFDVVYCWGVAHHTGAMWRAIENLIPSVGDGGTLVLSLYNDQGPRSEYWRRVKSRYQRLPRPLRTPYVCWVGAVSADRTFVTDFARRAVATPLAVAKRVATLRNPWVPVAVWVDDYRRVLREARAARRAGRAIDRRGMHPWYDLVDWVGGWPYEAATPEAAVRFVTDRGLALREQRLCDGHGCNEFVFDRPTRPAPNAVTRPARA